MNSYHIFIIELAMLTIPMSLSFIVITDYSNKLNIPINNQINNIIDSHFQNYTSLSQQERIDLLVKNHAINLDQQSRMVILEDNIVKNTNQYRYIPFIILGVGLFLYIITYSRLQEFITE